MLNCNHHLKHELTASENKLLRFPNCDKSFEFICNTKFRLHSMTPTDSGADAQTDPIAMVTFNRVVRFLCGIKTDSERGCIDSHSHLNLKPAQFYCTSEFGARRNQSENNFHPTLDVNGKWLNLWWKWNCETIVIWHEAHTSEQHQMEGFSKHVLARLTATPENIILRLCEWIKLKTFRSLLRKAFGEKSFYQQIPEREVIIRRVLILPTRVCVEV